MNDPIKSVLPDGAVVLTPIVRRFNDLSGCEYSENDFLWDLHQGEKHVANFVAGWHESESEAKTLLAEIVAQYDAAPDGPLGEGFTNGPFLRARNFLANDKADL